jgi:hypothetical protein
MPATSDLMYNTPVYFNLASKPAEKLYLSSESCAQNGNPLSNIWDSLGLGTDDYDNITFILEKMAGSKDVPYVTYNEEFYLKNKKCSLTNFYYDKDSDLLVPSESDVVWKICDKNYTDYVMKDGSIESGFCGPKISILPNDLFFLGSKRAEDKNYTFINKLLTFTKT